MSSMRGLPSYEEAEAQRKEREVAEVVQSPVLQTRLPVQNQGQTQMQMQTQNQVEEKKKMKMKMKERGSMSEPDLVGRFGHMDLCFEPGAQAVAETEARTSQSGTSDSVGIVQRLNDGEDDDDDGDEDDMGAGQIQMHIKKVRA